MSLLTHSKFIYGFSINDTNLALDFDEGIGVIESSLSVGEYTFSELADHIAGVMTEAGTQNYTVTIDRDTRFVTISAPLTFDLLTVSGPRFAVSVFPLIGFTGPADLTGLLTYSSISAAGSEYNTQFILQDYISTDDFQQAASAVVNKSAAGDIGVVKFGTEKFVQCDFKFITSRYTGDKSPIRNRPTGKQDFLDFMRFCTTKGFIEFFENEDNLVVPQKVILESTASNKDGTGYRLIEQYSKGLPEFYNSGKTVFRLVEN